MVLKLFLFILVAYSAQSIHASSEYALESSNVATYDEPHDLENLQKAVDYAVRKIKQIASDLRNELTETIDTIRGALGQIQEIISDALLKFGGLNIETISTEDKKRCVEPHRTEIQAVVQKSIKQLTFPIGLIVLPLIPKVITIVKEVRKEIVDLASIIRIIGEFYRCNSIICEIKLMKTAEEILQEAKDSFANVISLVYKLVSENAPKVIKVLKNKITPFRKDINKIVQEIEKCIENSTSVA